LKKTEGNPLPR